MLREFNIKKIAILGSVQKADLPIIPTNKKINKRVKRKRKEQTMLSK